MLHLSTTLPALAATAAAQEVAGEFDQVVEVRVVNVDVYVTDDDGKPVTGLTAEAFELEVDGRPVELSNFYAIEGGDATVGRGAQAGAGAATTPPPGRRPAQQAAPARQSGREAQPGWLVLYIDNASIQALHRTRVLRDVRRFLYEQAHVFDHILLASYEGSLHVRQPFTGDPEKIVRALDEVAAIQPFGDAEQDELFDLIRTLEDREAGRSWVAHRVEAYAQQRQNELRRALGSLRRFVESLAGLPGHKAMLYVSDGLPMHPGQALFDGLRLRYRDIGSLQGIMRYSLAREFDSLSVAASSAGVVLYTLDASGLTAPLAGDVEAVGSGVDNLRSTVGSVRTANLQAPLRKLAGETGGLAFLNSNRFGDELARLARDARAYYSLGFRMPHPADGRYHRIRVEVRRPGVDVRHRNGYRAERLETRLEQTVEAGLRWGAVENPFGVEVRAGRREPERQREPGEADTTVVVPVEISVPLDALVLLRRGDERVGRLRLALAVRDGEGGSSSVQRLELPIAIPADAYARGRGQLYVHELELRMRPGLQRIAVTIWDVLGREGSTAATALTVGG